MPEGNLIISGFNPFSLWGLHRVLGRKQGHPWCGQFIALMRLKDWLALLGFEALLVFARDGSVSIRVLSF